MKWQWMKCSMKLSSTTLNTNHNTSVVTQAPTLANAALMVVVLPLRRHRNSRVGRPQDRVGRPSGGVYALATWLESFDSASEAGSAPPKHNCQVQDETQNRVLTVMGGLGIFTLETIATESNTSRPWSAAGGIGTANDRARSTWMAEHGTPINA